MLKTMVEDAVIYAVLKVDGLGLGLEQMAHTLLDAGIDHFCVTETDDVRRLLKTNLPIQEILILRPLVEKAEIEQIVRDPRVTFTVGSYEDAELLYRIALNNKVIVSAHVAIDTGLGRYGLPWNDPAGVLRLYKSHYSINYTGIFTHFATPARNISVMRQYRRFQRIIQKMEAHGIKPGTRHCASSTALIFHPEMKMDAVRIGSALLGRAVGSERCGLQMVGYCEAQVDAVHSLSRGQTVGYGSTFRAYRNMQVAVVDIGTTHGLRCGYACGKHTGLSRLSEICSAIKRGFRREAMFSGEISNHIAPVVGNVFSECAVLDVTDFECHAGETVRFAINPMFIRNMKRDWI